VAAGWDRESDLVVLTRYILMFDVWLRMDALFARSPLVRGPSGGLKTNPAAAEARALHAALLQVEDRLGLQPRSRIAMGLAMSEGLATLEDLLGEEPDMGEFELPEGFEIVDGEVLKDA
jgi:phage terminase small subunit